MTTFSPAAVTQSPQNVADYLTETGNAPAALVSISNGLFKGSAASGVSDLHGDSAHADQSFEIGSQTKMMTALVVLQLVESEQLELDSPLSHYLDASLIEGVANADTATVGQALSMTTGMGNYTDDQHPDGTSMLEILEDNPDETFDTEEIVAFLRGLPASAPTGTTYEYSNTNYFYLSKVIEAVTKQSLGEVFQERIFEPLGMKDTFLNDFRQDAGRLSSYLEIDDEVFDVTRVLVDANGEGGVISTTSDMTKFMQAFLVDQTLVSPAVLAVMTDFENSSFDERGFMFNNGLILLDVEGAGSFVGFSGGSLGTDSASYLHLESGRIISVAVTQSNLDIDATSGLLYSAILAEQDPAWKPTNLDGVLQIDGISAADLRATLEDGAVTLLAENATLKLDGRLREFDSEDFEFSDGSKLLLGSQENDTVKVSYFDQDSWGADNQMRGFGGEDCLVGGRGDDRIFGGAGDDVVNGRAGDDFLAGGQGDDQLRGSSGSDVLRGGLGDDRIIGGNGEDRITGGIGSDWMTGGNGADVFLFHSRSNNGSTDLDVITDFQSGVDRIFIGDRTIIDVAFRTEGIELTLDGDADAILFLGLCTADDLSFL
ncbi:MAG: serine hydrolase [Roseobacter sp.]